MKDKVDWMKNIAVKNVTSALTTAVGPGTEYLTGASMGNILFGLTPVIVPASLVAAGAGYFANMRNNSNLEQQNSIQETIDKLEKKKTSIENKMEALTNAQGNKKQRQQYKNLAIQLSNVEFDISIARELYNEKESNFFVKKSAETYNAISTTICDTVTGAMRNISSAYQINGGGIAGLGYAAQETAKYANKIPGISGYPKAAIQIASGNILDGGIDGVMHSYFGATTNLSDKMVAQLSKTNVKEIKNLAISSIINENDEAKENTSSFKP